MKLNKFKRGEIWWAKDTGTYENGILSGNRPVLIISNNRWNMDSPVLNVILISSKINKQSPVHYKIQLIQNSVINTEQIFTIPKTKLYKYIKTLSKVELNDINQLLKYQIGL